MATTSMAATWRRSMLFLGDIINFKLHVSQKILMTNVLSSILTLFFSCWVIIRLFSIKFCQSDYTYLIFLQGMVWFWHQLVKLKKAEQQLAEFVNWMCCKLQMMNLIVILKKMKKKWHRCVGYVSSTGKMSWLMCLIVI